MLLAGDIGGTKTVLGVFSTELGPRQPVVEKSYPSADYGSLEEIALSFLAETGLPVESAVFGVAGPVIQGRAEITNLPWVMEEGHLAETLRVRNARLINDLDAIANSVPHLGVEDVRCLIPGEAVEGGAIAVIAPGTGLGEAFLTWDGNRYRPHASEGGHASFAPSDDLQIGLLTYLMGKLGHVSFERVCSGLGIPNIYEYLKATGEAVEPDWLAEELALASDPTRVIVNAGIDPARRCELCELTLDVFVSILGSEAGNLALKVLATGGVYVGGGIPPRILPRLIHGERFATAFREKGRFTDVLSQVPVNLIMHPRAALVGAAVRGFAEVLAKYE
ncbi:MAG: glucokinase [Anaerolineae bacterium]|jgi:glucokinase|nr:glucokinase [Anaerolineae bacterium]